MLDTDLTRPTGRPAAARGAAPPPRRWRQRLSRWDTRYSPILFTMPFFVLFAAFGLAPLLYTAVISLHKWDIIGGDLGWVGLEQYRTLMQDPFFWNALVNTLALFVLSTVPLLGLSLLIAWLLDHTLRAKALWRSGVLVPHIIAAIAVGLIFGQLYGKSGPVDWALNAAGFGVVDFQASRLPALLAVASIVVWRFAGYFALIYLAAMQAVPRELYEAAAIDGASRWRQFWSITVPQIRPTMIFTVVITTIIGLQLFAEPSMFDQLGLKGNGGSDRQFQTLMMYFYEKGFTQFNAGYGAAIAWVTFVIIALVGALNFLLTRRIARS